MAVRSLSLVTRGCGEGSPAPGERGLGLSGSRGISEPVLRRVVDRRARYGVQCNGGWRFLKVKRSRWWSRLCNYIIHARLRDTDHGSKLPIRDAECRMKNVHGNR